ncbi:MAG TPA: hypothetical protein ACQGQI_00080 [Xylella sp.]
MTSVLCSLTVAGMGRAIQIARSLCMRNALLRQAAVWFDSRPIQLYMVIGVNMPVVQ